MGRRSPLKRTFEQFALVIGLATILLTASAKANADDDARAQAKLHYEAGDRAFRLNELDRAVREFKAAYELSAVPLLLFNLGQAYRQKGDEKQALYFYRQYLATGAEGAAAVTARKKISELQATLNARETVQNAPPTGTVAQPPTVVTASPAPALTVEATPPSHPAPPPAWYSNPAGWTLLGVGVIGLAIGGGLLAHGNTLDSDIAGATSAAQAQSFQTDRDHYRAGGYAALGVGAAAAVAGAVVLGVVGSRRQHARALWVSSTGRDLTIGGAF